MATSARIRRMQASSSGSRKSAVPLTCACIFAPPKLLRRRALADRGLHQRGPGHKQARAFGHQHVIAHHRQISAAGHAHSHDGRDLRNAHRAHHRVIAKHAPKIVGVGKHIFLQGQEHAARIHQVNRRNMIVDGDVLRANHFLRRHREKRAGLHCGVVGDDHHQPSGDTRQAGDRAGRWRAAPFLVHFDRRRIGPARRTASSDRSAARSVRAPSAGPFCAAPRCRARRRPRAAWPLRS